MARRGGRCKATKRKLATRKRRKAPEEDEDDATQNVGDKTQTQRLATREVPNCPFFDMLRSASPCVVPMLTSRETCKLLISCSRGVAQDVREAIATYAFPLYCDWDDVVFALFQVDGPSDDENAAQRYYPWKWMMPTGVMHPVAFSLSAVKEAEQLNLTKTLTNDAAIIDTDNVEELARLMSIVEPEFGFRYFDTRSDTRDPTTIVEAHWREIDVDLESGATTCRFCENYNESNLFKTIYDCDNVDEVFTAYCADTFQPLKKFMLKHLKHVRYVRPPRGWNLDDVPTFKVMRPFLELMAGFTPAGVLVGVYLVAPDLPIDPLIPTNSDGLLSSIVLR